MIVHGFAGNDPLPPATGAAQRLFGLYRGLARAHETHVLAMVPNRHPGPRLETVAGVRLVRRKAWYTSLAWRLERWGVAPMYLAAHVHTWSAARIARALPGRPDVVMADIALTGVLAHARGAVTVYHAHNVEFDHFVSAGPAVAGLRRWAAGLHALEAGACAAARLVVVVSAEDGARMTELYGVPGERLAVVPNGYDETVLRPATVAERERARAAIGARPGERVALFLGTDVPHNRTALRLLIERVMPGLDGVRLLAAGSVTGVFLAHREPWLTLRPATPDVSPWLAAADLGLNPVIGGAGSNVKLPAYLAAGLAVVSTPHGLRGYADLAPWVTVASPESFADAIRAATPGWAARGDTPPGPLGRYAWGRLGESLGERFAHLVAAGAPTPASRPGDLAAGGSPA
ncbi:MAG: glycosyltransferase [Candidatus Eisenbacteria bacterium]